MFTGIVRERGSVAAFEDGRLVVESSLTPELGASVAVDGVCLTVVERSDGRISFDVVEETTVRAKPFGDQVNLEPALAVGDELGGHYVQGHVDGVGRIRAREGERLSVAAPAAVLRYCVEKGSIAVDGVSLTVAALDTDGFEVALVPHTLANTTLGRLSPGDAVNLEADVLAKYVERLLTVQVSRRPVDRSVQTDHGPSP